MSPAKKTADVHVACSYPHGPVHVDDGPPLTHTDDRFVTDTPQVRALIADGYLELVTTDDEQESS